MSAQETSDIPDRKAPTECSSEGDLQPLSRRALLTSLLALASGAAVLLDPAPAQARWGSFFGIPIPIIPYGGGRRSRRAGRRHSTARRGRTAGGNSARVARPGGSGSGGDTGKLGKADY